MRVLGYLIIALAKVLGLIINLYTIIIIASALISWVNADPFNPLVRILRQLTTPVFSRVRRLLPGSLLRARIDISPIVVLLILVILETVLGGLLYDLGRDLLSH